MELSKDFYDFWYGFKYRICLKCMDTCLGCIDSCRNLTLTPFLYELTWHSYDVCWFLDQFWGGFV